MRDDLVRRVQRFLLAIIILGGLAIAFSAWGSARVGEGPAWLRKLAGPPQTLTGKRIGIVAGHMDNDSGAVCDDGLTEASINRTIADGVVVGLRRRGAKVDLLSEFDSRLAGYRADAFVSIHADSCQSDYSGFKVASLAGGTDASADLVHCLWGSYETATGLARHPDTITENMTEYHAFKRIAAGTPAAIIETGFMKADRNLLTRGHALASDGIIAGIECFLAPAPAATGEP